MSKKEGRIKLMKNKKGFTLVELLIVITIIAIFGVMAIGIFNASGIQNKARDAQRKKDLNRIKVALEEYFNDNGSYPDGIASWNIKSNCGKSISSFTYLNPWPCDPTGEPYKIIKTVNPNRFVVLTNLEYKKDKDIHIPNHFGNSYNYGVSSSNVLWYTFN